MKRDALILFAIAGWALAVPHYGSEFAVSLALTCLMYVALSSSWALFCGSTRYLSLATAAFFGIGAYTSAIVLEGLGWWAAIALGAGMRGTQLAALAQARLPQLAVLLVSGYSAELLDADRDAPLGWELLRKPYSRDELAAALARLMAARGAPG